MANGRKRDKRTWLLAALIIALILVNQPSLVGVIGLIGSMFRKLATIALPVEEFNKFVAGVRWFFSKEGVGWGVILELAIYTLVISIGGWILFEAAAIRIMRWTGAVKRKRRTIEHHRPPEPEGDELP